MTLVYDRPQAVADWVGEQLGCEAPTVDAAIGYEVDGQFRAGVYFDGYTGHNIFAHIASSASTLPWRLLAAVANYVFVQLALKRMTFAVPASRRPAVQFVQGIGGELEALLTDAAGPNNPLMLFKLSADSTFAQRMLAK